MGFQTIAPHEIDGNVFSRIDKQWMLIAAGDESGCNTMTASWGSMGVLWGKPVATCYIRPQRHTLGFVQANDCFSLCFLPEAYRAQLSLCGSKSGRDMDKIAACGFTTLYSEQGAPYFAEAELVLICKKCYVDRVKPECFADPAVEAKWYKDDHHHMFIGEITAVLKNV